MFIEHRTQIYNDKPIASIFKQYYCSNLQALNADEDCVKRPGANSGTMLSVTDENQAQ